MRKVGKEEQKTKEAPRDIRSGRQGGGGGGGAGESHPYSIEPAETSCNLPGNSLLDGGMVVTRRTCSSFLLDGRFFIVSYSVIISQHLNLYIHIVHGIG